MVLVAWLIVAPFRLTYDATTDKDAIYRNDILVGTAVVVLALLSRAGAGSRPPAPAADEYHEK